MPTARKTELADFFNTICHEPTFIRTSGAAALAISNRSSQGMADRRLMSTPVRRTPRLPPYPACYDAFPSPDSSYSSRA
jgi:hypothetical protein